eukprot:6494055-Lingulodinium_polyedra.AAC.1
MVKIIVDGIESAARRQGAWAVLANENEDDEGWEDPAAGELSDSEEDSEEETGETGAEGDDDKRVMSM